MIAPESNDGKGLRHAAAKPAAITDLLMKS
jgi:hypothetical protein